MTNKDILDQGMISQLKIPVSKPTWLNQCGQWSIVYPSEYTRKKRKTRVRSNSKDVQGQEVQNS